MDAEEFIGIDVGSKRVGVARGSTMARLAEPLVTLSADTAIDELKQLADKHQVAGIVVGLPRNLSGDDTTQTAYVRAWADQAKQSIDLPFYFQDEALTSHQAQTIDAKTRDRVGEDALAAAIILQDFLNCQKAERVAV